MDLKIRTGSIHIPFRENARIAIQNYLSGRPMDEGRLPHKHIPDPRGWPEWITVRLTDG